MSHPPRIGRYHVVGRLATGGMAEILLGKVLGPSGFERPVVIKRILPSLATKESFVEMFLDEARVVARLQHPNVVHVHELGDEGGELFLVMEYLEGESAVSIMRRAIRDKRPLDRALMAYVVMQACAGLHAAHELTGDDGQPLHVVHRDVTPSNVFVTYAGGVKLIDFGVAKFAERSHETEAGQMKGKFAYMSPEQCLGRAIDRRSDVFSLGVVLFELTTGRRLFARSTSLLSMKAITEDRIPRPSEVVKDAYPPALDRIVQKSLSREPADRYPTAAAMRAELAAALREMDAPPLMEEQLAALMAERFPERLEEKRELLRRVQAGSEITQMPDVEVDVSVELPDADRGTPMGVVSVPERRARGAWPIYAAVAVVALAAGIGAAIALGGSDPPEPAPVPVVASAPEPAPEPEPEPTPEPVAQEPPAPARVSLSIASTPSGATVTVDGRERGATPIDLAVPRGDGVVVLTIAHPGHRTQTVELVPDRDRAVSVELAPAPRPNRRRPTVPPPATTPPTKQTGSPFRRFQ